MSLNAWIAVGTLLPWIAVWYSLHVALYGWALRQVGRPVVIPLWVKALLLFWGVRMGADADFGVYLLIRILQQGHI